MWAERRQHRPALWALIGALHLAWLLLPSLRQPQAAAPLGARIELRLLAARPAPAQVPRHVHPLARLALQAAAPAPRLEVAPGPRPAAEPAPELAPEPSPAPSPEPPAVRASAQPLLINTEATRRAVRMVAAGQPLLSERTQAVTGLAPRETPQARLGREIESAATTDCLKGDFLGAGLGPYSLPFWLLAQARGKCRR